MKGRLINNIHLKQSSFFLPLSLSLLSFSLLSPCLDGGYPQGSVGNGNSQFMVVPTGGTQTAGGAAGLNNVASAQGATAGTAFYGGSSGDCGTAGSGGAGGGGCGVRGEGGVGVCIGMKR